MSLDEVFSTEPTVTRAEAYSTIYHHGCRWDEFEAEHGDKSEYSGRTVLEWLGY